jgi:hypothetical protein
VRRLSKRTMPDLSLGEKQRLFAKLVGQLIDHIYSIGYEVTIGEALRTPEQAAINAKSGAGISNSNHIIKLAIDLNLFKNGIWLKKTEDFLLIGAWWKQQHELARWGGDFKSRPDGNHFSLEHNGVA